VSPRGIGEAAPNHPPEAEPTETTTIAAKAGPTDPNGATGHEAPPSVHPSELARSSSETGNAL